jgi:predicted TIM-barrel fold metal-dependent hydrolase
MAWPRGEVVDCDIHLTVPSTKALLPHLDEHWREQFVLRGLDRADFTLSALPARLPTAARPGARPDSGPPGSDLGLLQRQLLDKLGTRFAICHALHGAIALHTEDMGSALCRAVNDWVAREWLDRDDRLRASILVPMQNVDLAVKEIERCAADPRFVMILVPAMGDVPLGRRHHWPVWAAAERLGLPLGIHAGGLQRHAPSATGWGSTHLEDAVVNATGFDAQLASLISEGVLGRFPALKVVLLESGITWLPTFIWRMDKIWRGLRAEIPWVKRPPSEHIREQVRISLQPVDAPDAERLARTLAMIRAEEMLLFSTDWPHWHDDHDGPVPPGIEDALVRRMCVENPLACFPRLGGNA